jgi:hypothetical protein
MKALAIIKYLFSLIGLGMLVGAFFWYKSTNAFLAEATKAEGSVIELRLSRSSDSTTYAPVVNFVTRKGEEITFVSSVSSNPPSYRVGEKVDIFYLPANPYEAKINGFFSLWGGATIVGGLGGLFFLIGIAITVLPMVKGRRDENLKHQGIPIETEFQSVERNTAYSVNGRHPFRILTQWQNPATSEVHVFHSDNLWFDPTNYIKSKRITVFVERNNPKRYFVDLSFLPKMAE